MTSQSNPGGSPASYAAYMVRMWQESEEAPWRASAQCVRTGEKLYFSTLDSLFVFLEAHTTAGQSDAEYRPGV